jgi:hypothetical protein
MRIIVVFVPIISDQRADQHNHWLKIGGIADARIGFSAEGAQALAIIRFD